MCGSSGSSHGGQHGFVKRAGTLESGMNSYSSSSPEFSNSFWLSFVTLGLLFYSRGLSPFILASPGRCPFPSSLLSKSGERARFFNFPKHNWDPTVCPTTYRSVIMCLMGIIIGSFSRNSCKNEMRSGTFTKLGIQKYCGRDFRLVCSKSIPTPF